MTAYNLSPVSDAAQAIATALAGTCTNAGATCTWFDAERAIFTLATGDGEFFVQVLEAPPEIDLEQERRDYDEGRVKCLEDLLKLEAEQLAAYPREES